MFILSFSIGCKTTTELTEEQKMIKKNAEQFQQEILSNAIKDNIIALSDLTPFDWDKVFFFGCYERPEYIYDKVGYEWDTIRQGVTEGTMQIVFLNDKKVVCYVFGRAYDDLPFEIVSEKEELTAFDSPKFIVKNSTIIDKSYPYLLLVEQVRDRFQH